MKQIKDLKNLIEKYDKLIAKENFAGIEKLCEDGDIVGACLEIANECGMTVFNTKGFDSPGYELSSHVFTWIEDGKIQGIILDRESF